MMARPLKTITAAQLVERWKGRIALGTLANWRSQGKGPPFTKLGRQVLYPVTRLAAWEKSAGVK